MSIRLRSSMTNVKGHVDWKSATYGGAGSDLAFAVPRKPAGWFNVHSSASAPATLLECFAITNRRVNQASISDRGGSAIGGPASNGQSSDSCAMLTAPSSR